jgi:hypothetical protein
MSDTALAISFVDPARAVHGTARSGLTLLFEGTSATSHAEGPAIEPAAYGWKVVLDGKFDLEFEAVGAVGEFSGAKASVCAVRGQALGTAIDGMGVVTETSVPPRWDDLDALRQVHALFDHGHSVLAVARRPAGSSGHGDELVVAHLWEDGELKGVEDARLSTIYDGEGRPRQASMELWLPGEDFPRRAFGRVTAGASLALDTAVGGGDLDVHAAIFSWRMEGRDGAGLYELTVRQPAPAAA